MSQTRSLSDLTALATTFRDARDWGQFHQPKDLTLALGIEAGELGELFLWKTRDEVAAALDEPAFRARVADEIADVQLFLIYLAESTGIDIAEAVEHKLALNEARYPAERSRGSARKHDEL